MKKWLIFTILKILEIGLVVAAFYGLSYIGLLLDPTAPLIGSVAAVLLLSLLSFLAVYLIFAGASMIIRDVVRKNIEWAEKLSKKRWIK